MKVGLATATTLDNNYTINDTTVTVASTSGWPSDTGITFAIDVVDSQGVQVPGTYNEFVGTVASATSISAVDWADGSGDRNYSAGATTRVYMPVAKTRENRIVDWGLEHANQDGTLKTNVPITTNAATLTSPALTTPKVTTSINDANGNEVIKTPATSSAVNEITVTNAATGNAPTVAASGGDTNIDLILSSKGTGGIRFNDGSVGQTASVATSETTTSTSFTDLATTTDTVTFVVPSTGRVKVTVSAFFNNSGANQTYVDFAISGTNTRSASDTTALIQGATAQNYNMSKVTVLTGLTAGSCTFKMKYRVTGGTGTFANRNIIVEPFL